MKKVILVFNLALVLVACQKNDDTVLSKENKVGQSDPGDYSKYQNGSCNPTLKNTVGIIYGPAGETCPGPKVNNKIDNESNYHSFAKIDLNALYNFRDNFLGNSSKGDSYVKYYYQIGDFILKYDLVETSFTDVYNIYTYAVTVSNAVSAQSNGVIVTDEIYNFLKAKSTQIHQNAHYMEISAVIDVLDKDLEVLHGKNKVQFIDFFNQGY